MLADAEPVERRSELARGRRLLPRCTMCCGITGQVEAWESGHGRRVAMLAKGRNGWKGNRRVGVVQMVASEVNLTPFGPRF